MAIPAQLKPAPADRAADAPPSPLLSWRARPSLVALAGASLPGALGLAAGLELPALVLLAFSGGCVALAAFLWRQQRWLRQRCLALELANQQLRADNERMLQADRARGAFLASVSHEFRTPLNAILGFAEVLEAGSAGPLTERQAKYVRNIRLSGRHLLRLVNEVLDLTKIEAGQMKLAYARFPVARLLREAESILRDLADRSGIELAVDLDDLPPDLSMCADEERVKEVLLNLMANAIRFTPPGGNVRVRARLDRERLRVEVTDTGIGIAPQDQERIFEAFQQVDPTRARERRGTGLGLSLARRFVQLHGGEIGVESQLGRGSTFWFSLPLAPPAAVAAPTPPSAPRPAAPAARSPGGAPPPRPLALVVDDDPRSAELVGLSLRDAGYVVVYAGNGVEALAKASALRPSAISLEVLLPGGDGWAVLRALKADPDLSGVPVVLVSALDERERGLREGAYEVLIKPIERERLARVFSAPEFPRRPSARPLTILAAEAQPPLAELLRAALEAGGFQVMGAPDLNQAAREALARPPDLLLLPLGPLRLESLAPLHALRREPAGQAIPVLVVAEAEPAPEERERLRGLADGLLVRGAGWLPALVEEAGRLIGRRAVPAMRWEER